VAPFSSCGRGSVGMVTPRAHSLAAYVLSARSTAMSPKPHASTAIEAGVTRRREARGRQPSAASNTHQLLDLGRLSVIGLVLCCFATCLEASPPRHLCRLKQTISCTSRSPPKTPRFTMNVVRNPSLYSCCTQGQLVAGAKPRAQSVSRISCMICQQRFLPCRASSGGSLMCTARRTLQRVVRDGVPRT